MHLVGLKSSSEIILSSQIHLLPYLTFLVIYFLIFLWVFVCRECRKREREGSVFKTLADFKEHLICGRFLSCDVPKSYWEDRKVNLLGTPDSEYLPMFYLNRCSLYCWCEQTKRGGWEDNWLATFAPTIWYLLWFRHSFFFHCLSKQMNFMRPRNFRCLGYLPVVQAKK